MIHRQKPSLWRGMQVFLLLITVGWNASACKDEPTAQEYLQRAKEFQDRGDLRAAVIEYKNALRNNLDDSEARWLLGLTYVELGAGSDAEKELRHAVELGVAPEAAAIPLARAALMQGKFEDVMTGLAPSRLPNGDQAKLLALQGHAQTGLGNFGKAGELYDAALAHGQDEPEALVGNARLAATEGELESAQAQLEKVLESHPNFAPAWSLRGDIERFHENAESAEKAYSRAIELHTNNTEDRIKRAQIRIYLQDHDAAAKDLEALRKTRIPHAGIPYTLGLLHYQQQQYEDADTAFRKSLSLYANYLPAIYYLGLTNYMQGQLEQAEQNLRRFLDARPGFTLAAKQLAAIRLQKGDYDGAEALLKAVLGRDPDDAVALELMGSVAWGRKEGESGVEYFKKVAAQTGTASAYMKVGLGLIAEGKAEEALQEFEIAGEADPDQLESDILLVNTHINAGDADEALKVATRLVERRPESATAWNVMGVAHAAAKDYELARKAFRRALEIEPGSPPAAINLGRLALRAGDVERARVLFAEVRKKNPSHLRALLALAELEARDGNTAESLALLETARTEHPNALQPRLLLADFYLRMGQADKALAVTQEVAEVHGNNPALLTRLGNAALVTGDGDYAIESFEKLVAAQPDSADAHYLLASAYARTNRVDDMQREFDRALALDPKHFRTRLDLTELAIRKGDTKGAAQRLAELEREVGEHVDVLRLRGELATTEQRYDEATQAFAAALERSPNTQTMARLARAKWLAGDKDGSIAVLEDWLKDHPADLTALASLSNLYLLTNQTDAAEATLEKLIEADSDNALALNNLAFLLADKEPQRARDYAEAAYNLAPSSPAVMDTLAMLLLKQGESERSVKLLREASEQAPGQTVYRLHLAIALAQIGEKAEARTIIERLLAQPEFPERARAEELLEQLEGT